MRAARVMLLALATLVPACGPNMQALSSGRVGCPPETIIVENDSGFFGGSPRTWSATCANKKHYCSAMGNSISCKPAEQ